MRSTKQRKGRSIIQPGQTLHHFFKIAGTSDTFTNNNSSSRGTTSQEVIVIDPDDSDESTKPVKRRRLSTDAYSNRNLDETLSDIILLNAESPPLPFSVKLSDPGENAHSGVENTSPITMENKPLISFGSPVSLLSSTCPKPSCKEPAQSYSFGSPLALHQGNPAGKGDAGHSEHSPVVNHVSEGRPSFSQTDDVDIDLTLEDWDDNRKQSFAFKTEDDWMMPRNASGNVSCLGTLYPRYCSFRATSRKF